MLTDFEASIIVSSADPLKDERKVSDLTVAEFMSILQSIDRRELRTVAHQYHRRMNTSKKPLSSCCEKLAKVNMMARALEGEQAYFCSHCGESCDLTERRTPFKGSTLSNVRKPSGERSLFVERWAACKGRSEVGGAPLLPPDDPRFHFQGCHLLPKGSYQGDRLLAENVVMTTIEEHTEEWPLVKEKTDAELKAMGMSKWIPVVTRFRALRLKYHQRLNAELSGRTT